MEATWKDVKTAIKKQMPGHSFRMWIEPLEYIKCDERTFVLSSPNYFSGKRVREQYKSLIEFEIEKANGKACRLSIEIASRNNRKKREINNAMQLPLPPLNTGCYGGRLLRNDFTFDQFVVGNNNDFAYTAALSLASQRNKLQHSLFLLSKTGMGKTHLSQAIGHHIISEFPSEKVFYITAEDFCNEMVHGFRHDCIDKFKNKYRNGCDVLLLEDIHYLSGKVRTQEELLLALDTLLESGKKIIFSSCYLPSEIPKLNDKLKSRLLCSLISNIDPPDFRTRVRILQKKAEINGYQIPSVVIQYLASELTEDVRQLKSGLVGVSAKSSLLQCDIDLNLAESVVKHIVKIRKSITIDAIKKLVCKQYKITERDIVSRSRKKKYARPRQIAIYLARKYTDSPLQTIGRSFNRYHATALHSIGVVERELSAHSSVKREVGYICEKLESGDF